jgi:hypothetical protein
VLLLGGCAHRFSRDEDGYGYTSERTNVHYTVLDSCYEAAAVGEEFGEYTDKKYNYVTKFFEIPDLDSDLFLTDESRQVYCADKEFSTVDEWQVSALLICDEDAISVELSRLTDAAEIATVTELWFAGEESELPLEEIKTNRRLKLASDDCPGIYYCVNYYIYESGAAYFYDIIARRAVSVPAALAEKIPLN